MALFASPFAASLTATALAVSALLAGPAAHAMKLKQQTDF